MAVKFNTSTNIIRDENADHNYIVTPNAEHVATDIGQAYRNGVHSFTLIGSYGTGKSSFLLAFQESLKNHTPLQVDIGFEPKKLKTLRLVGQFQSLIDHFHVLFDISDDFEGNQKVFDHLFELTRHCDLLVIYIDEFGKFLEYASKNNPDRELYFLQQLAEFVNNHSREVLMISTLHQNFEAYAANMAQESQKKEWRKVKGRFKELTFNEPVEQLLYLAAKKLGENNRKGLSMASLAKEKHLLRMNQAILDSVDNQLAPLDVISAGVLTKALQYYGQNERSLFTFLESDLNDEHWFSVPRAFDYIYNSFYSYLESSYNPHYRQWRTFKDGIDRIESLEIENNSLALEIFKTIALIRIFGFKGAHIDTQMIVQYFKNTASSGKIKNILKLLEKRSLITYARYNNSFKVIDGTDVDFDYELIRAEESVERSFDLSAILKEHFKFPILQAKKVSYENGTPRLFAFHISTEVETDLMPSGAIDGYVNLVFNNTKDVQEIVEESKAIKEAVIVAYFTNSKLIEERIYEILKTKKVLADLEKDAVAKAEFLNILASNERLLTHEVIGSLYTEKVRWFFQGIEHEQVKSQRKLNELLSVICSACYEDTPVFKNELLNKHKISSSIHTARKNFFTQLSEHWDKPELNFDENRFPPEKTIYQSLLQVNGMHKKIQGHWELTSPNNHNGFDRLWKECQAFLLSAREEKKPITDIWEILQERPFKLKQGLIDFWVPTFLFINRGDFALYEENRFIPELNESIMYLITRQPHNYALKSFEITNLRLRVFNKYREVLEQDGQTKISSQNLIESLKPFLVFYKSLNSYAQKTQRLSSESRDLRGAIINAQDLEETFFEAIPTALKLDENIIESSDSKLSEFAVKLNAAIQELKLAYPELLNRLESFICEEIIGKKMGFEKYKGHLAKRYEAVKEHRLLPKQKVFLARLSSPINDRDSWLASIGQALLEKPLDQIKDHEEEVLKDRLAHIIQELDDLQELHKMKTEDGEQIYKLALTTSKGLQTKNVRIANAKSQQINEVYEEISKTLEKHQGLSLAVLSKLIEKELGK